MGPSPGVLVDGPRSRPWPGPGRPLRFVGRQLCSSEGISGPATADALLLRLSCSLSRDGAGGTVGTAGCSAAGVPLQPQEPLGWGPPLWVAPSPGGEAGPRTPHVCFFAPWGAHAPRAWGDPPGLARGSGSGLASHWRRTPCRGRWRVTPLARGPPARLPARDAVGLRAPWGSCYPSRGPRRLRREGGGRVSNRREQSSRGRGHVWVEVTSKASPHFSSVCRPCPGKLASRK